MRIKRLILVFPILVLFVYGLCFTDGIIKYNNLKEELGTSANVGPLEASNFTSLYDLTEIFFDESRVHEIRIIFNDSNWFDTLEESKRTNPENPYFPAQFTYVGLYENVSFEAIGIKMKGASSFTGSTEKKSFRLDFNLFNENQTLYGLKKLNLNNFYNDPSQMREIIVYDFFSQFTSCLRCVYTRVYFNDVYWGLYMAVEHPDQVYIESRWGIDEEGTLILADAGESDLTYYGDNVSLYNSKYGLKTNEEENNWTSFIELLQTLNSSDSETFQEQVEAVIDVDSVLYALALSNLFSNLDSYIGSGHNYFLYERDDTGLFEFITWDVNEAFGTFTQSLGTNESVIELSPFWFPTSKSSQNPVPLRGTLTFTDNSADFELELKQPPPPPNGTLPPPPPPNGTEPPPDNGTLPLPPDNETLPSSGNIRPLMKNLWNIAEYNRTYLQILARMLRSGFDVETLGAKINATADMIRTDVYADPNKPYTNEQFEASFYETVSQGRSVMGLLEFVADRAAWLDADLDEYAEFSDLCINEIMMTNTQFQGDNFGEYEPWVELYNKGPGLLQLGNYYLSDNPESPGKWNLPACEIDDGEFYGVWLDGENIQGENHSSFQLDTSSTVFILSYELDGVYYPIDTITLNSTQDDVSCGRYPDGGENWFKFSISPSFNAENQVDQSIEDNLYINEFLASNQNLFSDPGNQSETPDWIEIYNANPIEVDLSGYFLTDDTLTGKSWTFPAGSSISAYGYIVIYADGTNSTEGGLHSDFKLNAKGDQILLFSPDGRTLVDSVVYESAIDDISSGRNSSNLLEWVDYMASPTPGEPNIITDPLSEQESTLLSTNLYISLGCAAGLILLLVQYERKKRLDLMQNW